MNVINKERLFLIKQRITELKKAIKRQLTPERVSELTDLETELEVYEPKR